MSNLLKNKRNILQCIKLGIALASCLIGSFLLLLMVVNEGSSTTNSLTANDDVVLAAETSTDYVVPELYVQDKIISVPCYIDDIVYLGYMSEEVDVDYIDRYSVKTYQFINEQGTKIYCEFNNLTNEVLPIEDCPITSIRVTGNSFTINTVAAGDSYKSVLTYIGNPCSKVEQEDYKEYTYMSDTGVNFMVHVNNGKTVSSVTLFADAPTTLNFMELYLE